MSDLKIPNLNNNSNNFLFKKKLSLRRKSKRKLIKESFFMFSLGILIIYLNYLIPNKISIFNNLLNSKDETISGISKKAIKEVNYHLDRSSDWIKRLGLGTKESNERIQNAINDLWMYTDELFTDNSTDLSMEKNKIAPLSSSLKDEWSQMVVNTLKDSEIEVPEDIYYSLKYGKDGFHTEYLGYILAEMQHLPLLYPDATW